MLSEEEISEMRKELEKYGIQMPAFGKIGGILASEVTSSDYVGMPHDRISHIMPTTCLKVADYNLTRPELSPEIIVDSLLR